MKQWIKDKWNNIDWKYIVFCLLIFAGICVVAAIHYFLFTKPVEDRVNAEWEEKYEGMISFTEDELDDLKDEWYDKGYADGYADGVNDQ